MHRVPERESQSRRVQRALLRAVLGRMCSPSTPLRASAWVAAEHRMSPAPGARMRSLAMPCLDSCPGRGVDCSDPPPPFCQGHETGANVLQSSGYTSPARYVSHRASLTLALCGMAVAPARSYRHGTRLGDVLRGGPPSPRLDNTEHRPPGREIPRSRPRM